MEKENCIKQNRMKSEISIINVVCCILVVFIHVSSAPVASLVKGSWQYTAIFIPWRLSAFAVQGFIFLSGLKMFLNLSTTISYKKYYCSRFTKIIIPYILWNIVYYVYFMEHSYFSFSLSELLKYIANGTIVSPFYFIVVIIQFYLLAPLWEKLIQKTNPILMLTFSLLIMIIMGQHLPDIITIFVSGYNFKYNDRVFTTYLFYWVAGCYAGKYYEDFKTLIKGNPIFITTVFVISMCSNAFLSFISFSGMKPIDWLENIHFLYSISAVLFLYMIGLWIFENKKMKNKLLKGINASSYYIYLSHCLVIFIINDYLLQFGIHRVFTSYIIRILTVYPITIGLCILYTSGKKFISHLKLKKEKPSNLSQ